MYSPPSNSWAPAVGATTISSADWNTLRADLVTALSTCLLKDGQQTATANQPMGTYRHTGVSNASALTQYASADQVVDNALCYGGTSSAGSDTYAVNLAISPGAYAAGQRYSFIADVANTGACTINFNTIGAADIKLQDGNDPYDNAIIADQIVELMYDGTNMVLLNPIDRTDPSLAEINDTNGNEAIIFGATASAVNEVTVTNAASAGKPAITQTGADDVGIDIEGVEVHNGSLTASTTNGDLSIGGNGTGDITPTTGIVSPYSITSTIQIWGNKSNSGQAVTGWNSASANARGVFGWVTNSGGAATNYAVEGTCATASGYDFYASGAGTNYGPFTGGHDGLVDYMFDAEIGDILVDVKLVHAANISNSIFENSVSTSANQRGVIGVLTREAPQILEEHNGLPAALSKLKTNEVIPIIEKYKWIAFNAVGEGCINICGENGNIKNGDLIVASSMRGKGMKQDDDIVRSYTVAKSREDITFSNPNEVKQIACIYMCG